MKITGLWGRESWLSALAAVIVASATIPAQAQVIVLQSTVKSYKAGATLSKATSISIPAGNTMMVVLPTGATRTINGPYEGKVSQLSTGGVSNAALFNAVKKFVRTGGSSTSSVGALRSIAPGASRASGKLPFSWTMVPISASGDYCVGKEQPITLQRANAKQALTLTIVDLKSTQRVKVQFAAGTTEVVWPTEMPLSNGSYALLAKGRAMKQLRMRLIAPLPTPETTLQVLHGQRCSTQFAAYLQGFAAQR